MTTTGAVTRTGAFFTLYALCKNNSNWYSFIFIKTD